MRIKKANIWRNKYPKYGNKKNTLTKMINEKYALRNLQLVVLDEYIKKLYVMLMLRLSM